MTKNSTLRNISFDQSNVIKGILILLIILGHNHILVPQSGKLFVYLYNFHIYGFFILPFLYNRTKSFDFQNIINIVIKNWIPYFFFFILCFCLYHFIIIKDGINLNEFIYGLINGSSSVTKSTAGFFFLWFMPAYASMTIIMLLYNNLPSLYKWIIPFIGFVLYFFQDFTQKNLFPLIPFAITQGFYYFCFGFITKLLLENIPKIEFLGALVFVIVTFFYWYTDIGNTYYLFPVSGFLFVYLLSTRLVNFSFLIIIGKYSFPIYLLHIIIYNVLEILTPKSLFFGVIDFVLTLFISLLIGYLMNKVELIRKLILPKDLNDVKSIFVK